MHVGGQALTQIVVMIDRHTRRFIYAAYRTGKSSEVGAKESADFRKATSQRSIAPSLSRKLHGNRYYPSERSGKRGRGGGAKATIKRKKVASKRLRETWKHASSHDTQRAWNEIETRSVARTRATTVGILFQRKFSDKDKIKRSWTSWYAWQWQLFISMCR